MQAPVLFIPGTLCDERLWFPVWKEIGPLSRRYVPVQWANSLADMMQLTSDRVLPDEKVHLVGFSMGGYIAARWAVSHPERIASITLIGYCLSGLPASEITRRKNMLQALKHNAFNANEQFIKPLVHHSRKNDTAVGSTVIEMANDLGKSTLIAHTQSTTPRENLIEHIKPLNRKLTVIAADEDGVASFDTLKQEVAQIRPAHFHVMENTGHMIPLEQPKQLAQCILNSTLA